MLIVFPEFSCSNSTYTHVHGCVNNSQRITDCNGTPKIDDVLPIIYKINSHELVRKEQSEKRSGGIQRNGLMQ